MKTNFFTIPNILTLLRLPLAGLIILFANSFWKFVFLFLSVLFDVLDGYLARKLKQSSQLGAILDSYNHIVWNLRRTLESFSFSCT